MKKRFFSIFMALCLCLTLLPATALAADTPPADGADVATGLDLSTLPDGDRSWKTGGSDPTITYNHTDNKLTLNGATIDAGTGGTALNLGSNSVVIELVGTNTLTGNVIVSATGNITGPAGVSFTGTGSVTINGNVTVSATSGNISASSGTIAAIQASGGSVTVNGNVSVSATSGNITGTSTNPVAGVQASGGAQVSVTGSVSVSATGTTYGSGNISDYVAGVQASGANTIVNVSGSVTLSASGNILDYVAGVQASGGAAVTVFGGVSLSANNISGISGQVIFGVQAGGGAQVTVGSVTMTANATTATDYTMKYASGVEVSGNTTDKKTTVTVNGAIQMSAADFNNLYGIKETSGGGSTVTAGSVSIGDGTENKGATGVHAEKGDAAITITGDVTVDGEGVIAGGGNHQSGSTYDYKSGSQVTVNGSVTAANTGVKAGGGSVVTVQGDVTGSGLDATTAAVVGDSSGTITVGGNVKNEYQNGNSEKTGVGVYINGSSHITVGGDVTGGDTHPGVGLNVRLSDSPSQGSITVKGTVSGSNSLKFSGSGGNLTVSNLPSMTIGSYEQTKVNWGDNNTIDDATKQEILGKVQKYGEPVVIPTYAAAASETENGTVTMTPRRAERGSTVTITAKPDTDYILDTLTVLDKNGNEIELTDNGDGTFSFKMPTGGVRVAATFVLEFTIADFFGDVPEDAYYHDAALWAAKNGIASGTAEGCFSPHASCGRAQLITFLWRAAGCPVVDFAMDFSDVDENAYYGEAVRWAASLGIVGGYGNGTFGTGDTITREQMATILYRFAEAADMDVRAGENTNLLRFADASDVSEYATLAVQWAVGSGIMEGSGDKVMPHEPCTRAQIVTLLYRLLAQ